MAKKAKVDYDPKEDSLFVSTGEVVKDSIDFDRFIFDFSHDDQIVGVEINGFSEYLKDMLDTDNDIDRKQFNRIKTAFLSVRQQREYALVKLILIIPPQKRGSEEARYNIQVFAPVVSGCGAVA